MSDEGDLSRGGRELEWTRQWLDDGVLVGGEWTGSEG